MKYFALLLLLSNLAIADEPDYKDICKACGTVLKSAIAPKFYQVKEYKWEELVRALREQQNCFQEMQGGFPLSVDELQMIVTMEKRLPDPVHDYEEYAKNGDATKKRLYEALLGTCPAEKRHSVMAQAGVVEGPTSCYESAQNVKASLEKQLPASKYSYKSKPGNLNGRYVFEVVNRYEKVGGWIDFSSVKFVFNHYVTRVLDRMTGKTYIVDGYRSDIVQLEEDYAKDYFVFDRVKECLYTEYHKAKYGKAPADSASNLNPTLIQGDMYQVENIYKFCMEI